MIVWIQLGPKWQFTWTGAKSSDPPPPSKKSCKFVYVTTKGMIWMTLNKISSQMKWRSGAWQDPKKNFWISEKAFRFHNKQNFLQQLNNYKVLKTVTSLQYICELQEVKWEPVNISRPNKIIRSSTGKERHTTAQKKNLKIFNLSLLMNTYTAATLSVPHCGKWWCDSIRMCGVGYWPQRRFSSSTIFFSLRLSSRARRWRRRLRTSSWSGKKIILYLLHWYDQQW